MSCVGICLQPGCVYVQGSRRIRCVQSGQNILIAEEPETFAVEIERLLTDRQLVILLSERSRKVVNTHYSWKSIMQGFLEALNT